MLDGSAHPHREVPERRDRAARRSSRPARRLALALLLALASFGVLASAAQAEPTVGNAEVSCKQIVVTYSGFPNAPGNTIKESVRIDGVKGAVKKTFVFNGPEGTDTIEINLPPGEHSLDLFSVWRKTNGVSGNRDQALGKITCTTADPGLEDEKLQKFHTKQKYTKETLKLAHVGEVVDYEIVVKNTGNVPLNLEFSDPRCDAGTITGGPTGPLPRGESTTYFCKHTVTEADREAGSFCNTATVTGTSEGPPVSAETNTVCTEVPNPKTNTEFSCKSITLTLNGFPNVPNNMVKIKVTVDGNKVLETTFTFNGSTGVFTYELNLPPGHHSIDVFAIWKTNGFNGNHDQSLNGGITCEAEPNFSIEKLQKIEGSASPFTTEQLEGSAGQTVDYEVVITNTGNTALTFGPLNDPKCDEGTIEGGPGATPVQPAGPSMPPGKTVFTCKHTLTAEDEVAGEYTNSASETGTPPEGQGSPVTKESNTVTVAVGEII